MKYRIWYRPTRWLMFGMGTPLPWRLDVPACFWQGHPPTGTEFATFSQALTAFKMLLPSMKRAFGA
jgi:hypothetical protein